ncbi:MAG: ATP-binding cassette domain-containing protein, partial [Thermoleophilaceae bacterium]
MKLELSNVTKRFGAVVANDAIDLTVERGEIHCLLGENGAGKSTLMNLLFGAIQPDAGEIRLDGRQVRFPSPRAAIEAGIGMVHQHFTLVPTLTVAENVMLGYEQAGRLGWLRRERAHADVDRLAERYGLEVSADAIVGDLPVGLQQRVEIMKALRRDARLLILDEPTAVLTPQEAQRLFDVMRELRDGGNSVIFISHKLPEVRAVADR